MAAFHDPEFDVSEGIIKFYFLSFYPFNNFSAFAVEWRGKVYPTAEHAYQAAKFFETAPEIAEEIRRAFSPDAAKTIAYENPEEFSPDWDDRKVAIMEEILRAKVAQNPLVAQKLRQAKKLNLDIVEDSPVDSFWGWGPNRLGRNELGKLWMKLRDELSGEEKHV